MLHLFAGPTQRGGMDWFGYVVVLLLVAALIIVRLAWIGSDKAKQRRQWQAVAQRHGLSFTTGGWPGHPHLNGSYRGRPVSARAEGFRYVRGVRPSAQVIINLNAPSPLRLMLSKKTLGQQLGEIVKPPAIKTGDAWIDRLFDIDGQPAPEVTTLLHSRALLPHLQKPYFFKVDIAGQALIYTLPEHVGDPQALLDAACDLADSVEAFTLAQTVE